MTHQEENQLAATRAVNAQRLAAQEAAHSAQLANHNATRLFYAALAAPTCAETNQAARRAQDFAAAAQSAAEAAARALVALVSAQHYTQRPAQPVSLRPAQAPSRITGWALGATLRQIIKRGTTTR